MQYNATLRPVKLCEIVLIVALEAPSAHSVAFSDLDREVTGSNLTKCAFICP